MHRIADGKLDIRCHIGEDLQALKETPRQILKCYSNIMGRGGISANIGQVPIPMDGSLSPADWLNS